NFTSERDVVKEEYRQSILAPPYGRFGYLLQQESFLKHPYRRPTIGSIEDLDAASLAEVQSFHSTYYRPDNATLVVVGDFDQKQLNEWVYKYFASIPKATTPLPRVNITEPARLKERRVIEYGSNVPLPAVGITYLTPSLRSADSDALRVAQWILNVGESSRLYHSLVYEQQVAQSADASQTLLEDVSLFSFSAVAASGRKLEAVEAALLAEITKMQTEPVKKSELDKAINQILTYKLQNRETNEGKATALGTATVIYGDPERVNTDLDNLKAVTAADVQNVMKKYFARENRLVLYYLSETEKKSGAGAKVK
ncbi:MAG TPA: pitrilysin family protein, partial [Pyrinomonadaceae bacterium]|nr:pitrilysin family protein [Pyrinomonadaceae bacterium]